MKFLVLIKPFLLPALLILLCISTLFCSIMPSMVLSLTNQMSGWKAGLQDHTCHRKPISPGGGTEMRQENHTWKRANHPDPYCFRCTNPPICTIARRVGWYTSPTYSANFEKSLLEQLDGVNQKLIICMSTKSLFPNEEDSAGIGITAALEKPMIATRNPETHG